jgi:hypothetical protein
MADPGMLYLLMFEIKVDIIGVYCDADEDFSRAWLWCRNLLHLYAECSGFV